MDLERPAAVVEAAAEIGFDVLLSWVTDGPDRPPDDASELLAWAAAR